jgi:hypothetical protein
MMLEVFHRECHRPLPDMVFLCEPRPRKDLKALFPKWWCPVCHRYVLPDGRLHFSRPAREAVLSDAISVFLRARYGDPADNIVVLTHEYKPPVVKFNPKGSY